MSARLHAPDSKSTAVRKKIEKHTFDNEEGDEYSGSRFGGFTDYFRRKKIKLQNLDVELRSHSEDRPRIFAGVVAFVNGYTQPSLNDLHKLIVTHGGGFLQYLDGKTAVTHIIASNLTPKKREEFRRYRIVKPAWVVDSVNAGRLLPWDEYRVVDEGRNQKVLGFNGGRVVSQVSNHQNSYKGQTERSWYTDQLKGSGQAAEDEVLQGWAGLSESQEGQEEGQAATADFALTPSGPSTDLELRRESLEKTSDVEAEAERITRLILSPGLEQARKDDTTARETSKSYPPAVTRELSDLQAMQSADELRNEPGDEDFSENEQGAFQSIHAPMDPTALANSGDVKRADSSEPSVRPKAAEMTAEEHNSLLLADPHIRKMSAVDPNFLKQYYSESRLHHLSTWKADLKAQLQRMTTEQSPSQQAAQKRPPGARRYILHVDFDSFFASVSLKNAPHLKDKPVVVAHSTGTGSEIASCNYPARKHGVKNGMWMKSALKLCPDLKVLPYDFKAYEEASKEFYRAILEIDGVVQSVSVDEALVDVTSLCLKEGGSDGSGVREGSISREQAKAEEIAGSLRKTIQERTGCSVSVGIGGNILLAKVALRKAKPAGQYLLKPEDVLHYIGDLTVQSLPGIAHSIGGKLEELGIKLVKDVRGFSKERLMSILGPKTGEKLYEYSRGIDRTEVGAQVERKSVSAEVNWGIRFENQDQADTFMRSLCEELHARLKEQKVKGKQLTLKLMKRAADAPLEPPKHLGHGKCDTFNKSVVLGVATNEQAVLEKEFLSMLKSFGFSPGDLRGIGLQTTKLEPLRARKDDDVESSQRKLMFKATRSASSHDADEGQAEGYEERARKEPRPSEPAPARSEPPVPRLSDLLGTQFALPSQVDPSVLAELPEEIRSKLSRHTSGESLEIKSSPKFAGRSESPVGWSGTIPTQSQLDKDILAALPEELKQEVLSAYQKPPTRPHGQSLLPQSPRKAHPFTAPAKKATTPTKKQRTGLFARARGVGDSHSTLTQSNFVTSTVGAGKSSAEDPASGAQDGLADEVDEISAEFLEALPEPIRREVLAQHRRERLKRRSKLDISSAPGPYRARRAQATDYHQQQQAPAPPQVQRRLRLPARPAKATFTTKKLSTLPELRAAISSWVVEFADDGPYDDDVAALAKYLGKIVRDGRELDKAVALVRWIDWVKDDEASGVCGEGKVGWEKAVSTVADAVQSAVKERGLGPVEF